MAKALLELETIDADQIDDIMAGRPPRPPRAATPARRARAPPPSATRRRTGAGSTTDRAWKRRGAA